MQPTVVDEKLLSTPTTYLRMKGRSGTFARIAWIILAAISVFLYVSTVIKSFHDVPPDPLHYQQAANELHTSTTTVMWLIIVAGDFLGLTFLTSAFLIFWKRSDNGFALLLSSALLTTGTVFSNIWRIFGLTLPLDIVILLYVALSDVLRLNTLLTFPDGRYFPRWTWMLVVLESVYVIPQVVVAHLAHSTGLESLDLIFDVGFLIVGLVAQVYRYRRASTARQQQQTRWAVYGIGVAIVGYLSYSIPFDYLPLFIPSMPRGTSLQIFVYIISILSLTLVPICGAIAVLRYQLFDIDVIIRRSLVYGALTVGLGTIYFLSFIGLQSLFQQSPIPLAASALLIAGLFQPARVQLKRFVALHVYHETLKSLTQERVVVGVGAYSGKQIGVYEIHDSIGAGGMAEVYKGRHIRLNRPVAIKVMSKALEHDPDFRHRFEREARTVAALRHPNIVQVFDFGEIDSVYYIAMEFIDGQDLAHYLRATGRLSLDKALPLLRDIGSALDYAHQEGLIHRDIKPSNVMLQSTPSGKEQGYRAILTDFGLARVTSSQSELTTTGTVGTLGYISPEQIIAAKDVTPAADLYSLGVMAYQMLTGTMPFHAENPAAILMKHLQTPPPDPRIVVPDLPDFTAAALKLALAKDPDERFPTADRLICALAGNQIP